MAYNYYPFVATPYYPVNAPYNAYTAQNSSVQQDGQPINQRTPNNAQNGFIWVQGEAGAKAYPVAPNSTVQLWDSESQTIYLKSADASGLPSMKTLEYSVKEAQPTVKVAEKSQVDLSGYVTKEEFEKRIAEISGKAKKDE